MFEKLVTHSGQFHADDVFAAATLRKLAPMALLIRTRDPDVLAEVVADQSVAVFDVGDHFEPERFNFDHHQRGFERAREDSGIPYAAFVSQRLSKPMIYIRKSPKGYGQTRQIEGVLEVNQRVLLVEDLVTDGMSKLRFNIGIRAQDAKITDCLCVFEYSSDRLGLCEGKKNLADHDILLHTLANWDHVLDIGLAKNLISDESSKQILDFLAEPEGWGRKMGFE